MEAFGLKTTRYSVVLRRLIEASAPGAEFRIDRQRYTEHDLPWLLHQWCTNRNIRATRDFEIRRNGEAIAGFHDGPAELWVAASERPLIDQLISEKLARIDAQPLGYASPPGPKERRRWPLVAVLFAVLIVPLLCLLFGWVYGSIMRGF